MDEVQNEGSDAQVIRQVLDGNVNAFETLMERYQGYVAAIAAKNVPRDRIEEIAQETFLRAYRSLETFRGKTHFKHWLATIAVRCCQDFWRQHYRRSERAIGSISEEESDWIQGLLVDGSAHAASDPSRNPEALRVLRWAMEGLSAEDRAVLTLVHLEEYTTAEAARLLRWSVAKVKIRAHRARKKLRKTLEEVLPDR